MVFDFSKSVGILQDVKIFDRNGLYVNDSVSVQKCLWEGKSKDWKVYFKSVNFRENFWINLAQLSYIKNSVGEIARENKSNKN